MNKLMIIALACLVSGAALAVDGPLEIRKSELVQREFLTEIRVEAIARYYTSDPIMFVRLRCEVLDSQNQSLVVAMRDFGPYDPAMAMNIPTGRFFRPSMQLPHIENADHASCRFANASDPLPTVDIKDVTIELLSTTEVQITNRSIFRLASIAFSCRGSKVTTHYDQGRGFGFHLGYPPHYTTPSIYLRPQPGMASTEAIDCWTDKVEVQPAQNLDDLRHSNW
jgi:hypothetical protein